MNKKDANIGLIIGIIVGVAVLFTIFLGFIIFAIVGFTIFTTVKEEVNGKVIELTDISSEYISPYKNPMFTDYETFSLYFKSSEITKNDFKNNNFYVFSFEYDSCSESDFELNSIKQNGKKVELEFTYESSCGLCAPDTLVYAYKVDKDVKNIDLSVVYKARNNPKCPEGVAYKPMIYIYPEEDMEVEINVSNPNNLGVTYPKYNEGWKVFAKKDGTILSNEREYYGLFWEGNNYKSSIKEDGFVIKGEDTSKFLEEKLEILGLNEKEINEFMVFWLPKMEDNKYNYIRFSTNEEINEYMSLDINPSPDTLIRVFMNYRALNKIINVNEQILTPVTRSGYTVVEWGGSEI